MHYRYLEKNFLLWSLSELVEPVAGVLGTLLITIFTPISSHALSFAVGASIFVVIEDIIPECQREVNIDIAVMAAIGGFIAMMILDVALV